MNAQRVLVIGGTGHMGSYLVPRLVGAGYAVTVVTRGSTTPYVAGEHWAAVETITLDRPRDEQTGRWSEALARVKADIVVDLIPYEPSSTVLLYELFRGRVGHFLHCGTCWEYGVVRQLPTPEDHPLSGCNLYAQKKVAMRRFLLERHREEGFPATILSPTQISGPGKPVINPWGDRNDAVWQRLARGGDFPMPGDGNTPLMHIHAADCAQAFFAALQNPGQSIGKAFNLGAAYSLTYNGLAELGARLFGVSLRLQHMPLDEFERQEGPLTELSRSMLAQPVCVDITSLRALGYTPQYRPEDAVQIALEWAVSAGRIEARIPQIG